MMTAIQPPPRLQHPDRHQLRLETMDLDGLVDADHPVRMIWMWVERVDMSALYDACKARGSNPGRAAIDPRILLCLWLYATSQSVGSARLLERLCNEHNAYRWILGGVSVNYHTLSDFRSTQSDFLDQLLTNSLAALVSQGVLALETVAQDGMRVRAAAGRSSFRRKGKLLELQQQCAAHIEQLKKELESNPDAGTKRMRAARERAARERGERIDAALQNLERMEKRSEKIQAKQGGNKPPTSTDSQDTKKPSPPRASTTDPECERMKMANGGFDPAFNFQYATDAATRMIVGVEVTGRGSDSGMMNPLMAQLAERCGKKAGAILADSGYLNLEDITATEKAGTKVHVPLKKKKDGTTPSGEPCKGDTEEVAIWRARMAGEDGRKKLKERGSLAEWANAQARNHGLTRLLVRGLKKVKSVALLHALTINLERMHSLKLLNQRS